MQNILFGIRLFSGRKMATVKAFFCSQWQDQLRAQPPGDDRNRHKGTCRRDAVEDRAGGGHSLERLDPFGGGAPIEKRRRAEPRLPLRAQIARPSAQRHRKF